MASVEKFSCYKQLVYMRGCIKLVAVTTTCFSSLELRSIDVISATFMLILPYVIRK